MRLSLGILGIAGSLLVFTSPASAAILARCGTSSGQAFYEDAGTWTPDKIGKGGFEFVVDDKGSPNVHFVDTTGGLVDAAADGAKVTFSFIHHELGEFGIVVIYEATGVVETYNVIKTSTKSKVLYWTANRSMASQFSKVSAMVAQCSP